MIAAPSSTPRETGWRAAVADLTPALFRLSLLVILGSGAVAVGGFVVAAALHAFGYTAPLALAVTRAALWLFAGGYAGFALFLALDIAVDRR